MNIRDYYQYQFRADVETFMPDTRVPYFGHSWEHDCRGLDKIPSERRTAFLICIYFTVLVDQAMHAHFRSQYLAFESLTRYPKYCHSLGQFQKNPRGILLHPVEQGLVPQTKLEQLLDSSMELFVEEVDEFFQNHMPAIEPKDFFDKILYDSDVQIPLLVVLVSPELKDDIVVKTYEALRKAVEKKYTKKNQQGTEGDAVNRAPKLRR